MGEMAVHWSRHLDDLLALDLEEYPTAAAREKLAAEIERGAERLEANPCLQDDREWALTSREYARRLRAAAAEVE